MDNEINREFLGDTYREPSFEYRTVTCPRCGKTCGGVIEAFDTLGFAACPYCENEFTFELEE